MKPQLDLLRARDRRELSRWFTAVERQEKIDAKTWKDMEKVSQSLKRAPVIGFSGPPGAGKSSLLHALLAHVPPTSRVLVLCIDPSSPVSGGALLGDRVRIQERVSDAVFIRSFSNHAKGGGVTPFLKQHLVVGQNAGFDFILVEGVGSGQAEYALHDFVDLHCLVLVPESGDGVQMLKAGVIELAHVIVLNKSDRPGAEQFWEQLKDSFPEETLFKTVATENRGAKELWATLSERALKHARMKAV